VFFSPAAWFAYYSAQSEWYIWSITGIQTQLEVGS